MRGRCWATPSRSITMLHLTSQDCLGLVIRRYLSVDASNDSQTILPGTKLLTEVMQLLLRSTGRRDRLCHAMLGVKVGRKIAAERCWKGGNAERTFCQRAEGRYICQAHWKHCGQTRTAQGLLRKLGSRRRTDYLSRFKPASLTRGLVLRRPRSYLTTNR